MIDERAVTHPAGLTALPAAAGEQHRLMTTVVLAAVAAATSLIGAVELDDGLAWSALGVVATWSMAALVVTAVRPDSRFGIVVSSVPLAVAATVLTSAFADEGVFATVRAMSVAAVPVAAAAVVLLAPNGVPCSVAARRAWWAIGALGGAMAIYLAIDAPSVASVVLWAGAGSIGVVTVAVAVPACRGASVVDRARIHWIGWGITVAIAMIGALVVAWAIADWPDPLAPAVVAASGFTAVGVAVSAFRHALGAVGAVLVHTIVMIGMAVFVVAVYLVVVVGLDGVPDDGERTVLALSMLAAAVVAITAVPVHRWLRDRVSSRVRGDGEVPEEALETFATRMSRAVPMDELLLQLVETLRKTMKLTSAEVWTGSDGRYELTVAVPHRREAPIVLGPESLSVASRAHVQGNAWLAVWIPALLVGRDDRAVRFTSVAHLGELLGFIVTERPASAVALDEDDEHGVLIDIARQLGLALHNVRLDNALQASLDDLRSANDELVASRARIVAATDESRRRIERNLHDGAQQHLVALAVKVGLVRQLLEADPETATAMLDELRGDVQATLTELRELAHGIYPPRLRDRGLADALGAAADRCPLPAAVHADGIGRYGPDIETAVYFCCVEAIQNSAKHAGDGASLSIRLAEHDGSLMFEVADDGVGFDVAQVAESHGFVNMRDRLGAFAGALELVSSPGAGATVRGRVPLP